MGVTKRIDRFVGTHEIEPQNRLIGKGCNRTASKPVSHPFHDQADRDHDLIIISRTIRCLKMRIGMIHDDIRTGIRMGTNPVKTHPVECPLDLEQIQNGFVQW